MFLSAVFPGQTQDLTGIPSASPRSPPPPVTIQVIMTLIVANAKKIATGLEASPSVCSA